MSFFGPCLASSSRTQAGPEIASAATESLWLSVVRNVTAMTTPRLVIMHLAERLARRLHPPNEFNRLPDELIIAMLARVPSNADGRIRAVCRRFNEHLKSSAVREERRRSGWAEDIDEQKDLEKDGSCESNDTKLDPDVDKDEPDVAVVDKNVDEGTWLEV